MHIYLQLYQCVPQVLLPVLPHLHAELEATEEAQRLAAAELLVSLLCTPASDISEHFPKLAVVRGRAGSLTTTLRLQQPAGHHACPGCSSRVNLSAARAACLPLCMPSSGSLLKGCRHVFLLVTSMLR